MQREATTRTGVLLVNLGTPDSYQRKDVYRYLKEFLLDPRVIDIPRLKRNLLVRGIIVPFRAGASARTYKTIWTDVGSPLLVYGQLLQEKLQHALGDDFVVELGMRYQNPSIAAGLKALREARVGRIIVLPLFPQYASATTGSVHQKVMEIISAWPVIPDMRFINSYYDDPLMIGAFAENGRQHRPDNYDHVLFSFHGLPERQIRKADDADHCLSREGCCTHISERNQFCYRAQCFATARAIAAESGIAPERYTVAFQSRLGKAPWIQPYSIDLVKQLPGQGVKRLLVFSPAFVADCLETLYEIGIEYAELFKKAGGKHLQLVESLNARPGWVEAVKAMVLREVG